VLEIGSSLHEVRIRRGVELAQVEADTHIRTRYLKAFHEGTLEQGQTLRFAGKRLWIRLGAPSNLEASLNGVPASLPDDTANVVVTTAGVRTVEVG